MLENIKWLFGPRIKKRATELSGRLERKRLPAQIADLDEKVTPQFSREAMLAVIREARDELASDKLKHIGQVDPAKGRCFNMGMHRIETSHYSIVSLVGLVEQKLGLPYTGMIDLMRGLPDNSFSDSLWDLFYPDLSPAEYDNFTPQDTVALIDRWQVEATTSAR